MALDEAIRNPVVLLLDHRSASWSAIRRALAMAKGLDTRLHVVLSVPVGASAGHPALVASHVADLLEIHRPPRGYDLEVISDALANEGREIARHEQAQLVVVDPWFGAHEACRLADDLEIPVLVARDAREAGDWIAASDMQSRAFPVLVAAREIARSLERDVVFFHNARPLPVFLGDPMAGAGTYAGMLQLQDDAAAAKRARLQYLSAREPFLHSVVARDGSTVDAVLDLARERDADVIVMGHRRRSWLWRLLGRGTAEKIVYRSRRSVLIIPLERGAG